MNFASFDLNLLRVLDALLTTHSTTLAGQKIGLSQPAVSAALGRLRHSLGDPLFIRQGRRLVPTEYAQKLQTPLRDLLDKTETLLSPPGTFDPFTSDAEFKLSGSDFFAELLMPSLAAHLAHKAPNMRVQLVDSVPDSHVGALERQGIHMAMIPDMAFPDWVAHHPLHRSHFVTIARQDHPRLKQAGLCPGDRIPLDLFCDLHHVLFSPEGHFQGLGDAALHHLGRKRHIVMTLPVFSGVCTAVSRSDLIALMPHQLAQHSASRLGLSIYKTPLDIAPVSIKLIWHKRSDLAPAHKWLRDQIVALMAPLDTPPEPAPSNPARTGA
ncbi:MAG: LysR family transcriptional regulator [Rhodobacteraceae bacterium]|nr:LysR family transcriptional regulator [Paracoccaceae bacterium]